MPQFIQYYKSQLRYSLEIIILFTFLDFAEYKCSSII